MKKLLLLLLPFFSYSQSVVLDGRSGTTEILPGIKSVKRVDVPAQKTRTVGNTQPIRVAKKVDAYTLTLNFDEARQLKNHLTSVVYEDIPNATDEAAFEALKKHIKTNKEKTKKPTITLSVSPQKMEQMAYGGGMDSSYIIMRFQDEMIQARFFAKIKAAKAAQDK